MLVANVRALVWEILAKNIMPLLLTFVLLPIVWLILQAYLNSLPSYSPLYNNFLSLALVLLAALNLGLIFSYVDFTPNDMTGGFPKHVLLLPVPTWLLALVPIVTGSFFIGTFVLLWLRFISDLSWDWSQQLIVLAAITSLVAWIQALSWELFRANLLRIFALTAVVWIVMLSVRSLLYSLQVSETAVSGDYSLGVFGITATLFSGYALSFLSVFRLRRGDSILLETITVPLRAVFNKIAGNRKLPVLTTPQAAQNWIEWKMFGWVLPSMALMISAVMLFGIGFDEPSIMAVRISLFFLGICPYMGGTFALDSIVSANAQAEMRTFVATRPLSDFELAMGKLRLSAKSLLLSQAMVGVSLLIVLMFSQNNSEVLRLWSLLQTMQGSIASSLSLVLGVVVAIVFSWALSTYSMSMALYLSTIVKQRQRVQLIFVFLLLFTVLIRSAVELYRQRETVLSYIESAYFLSATPFLLLSLLGCCLLPRFKLSNSLQKLRPAALSILAGLTICLLLLWQLELSFGLSWSLSWVLATTAVLGFIPFLLMPNLIGLRRHR